MVRFFGSTFLAIFLYAMLSAVVLLFSMVFYQKGVVVNLPWISSVQSQLYSESRNIWQANPDCVVFDSEVIYKPKIGKCHFNNLEYQTELNFSTEGRYTGEKPSGTGIAVLGDSHAMGWGVADNETFSSELQRLSGRPVFNLGVSSYATDRELIRLEKSGVLEKVDTVIIQYCENDLDENAIFQPLVPEVAKQKFPGSASQPRSLSNRLNYIRKAYWVALKDPFSLVRNKLAPKPEKTKDFTEHYQPFIDSIKRHDGLRTKRVIVFYSNAHGKKFTAFPDGKDPQLHNLEFIDLELSRSDYFEIDDHLHSAGHAKAGQRLFQIIQSRDDLSITQ